MLRFIFFAASLAAASLVFSAAASAQDAHAQHGASAMPTSPLGIPMDRMGSGTTWIPDAVPLPSKHTTAGRWDFMLHGWAFLQYNTQGGPRGADQFGSSNWGMLMAGRSLAGGRFQARAMLSLDPATVTNRGYPLLLQSGETYRGEPIVDRQHPHDFLMELGVLYERAIGGPLAVSLYVAPSGEPALGPVAYMHRPSASESPLAPLSHHWQDATHISFGVLTVGVFTRAIKLEASAFNGREPDERRWNIDRMRVDSYSGRLTVNPGQHWSAAAAYGFLRTPEALHPGESMHRATGSILYGTQFGEGRSLSAGAVWGANRSSETRMTSHSILAEAHFVATDRSTFLMRAERAAKSAGDLALDAPGSGIEHDDRFNVVAFSLGYVREFAKTRGATIGIGAIGTANLVPRSLEPAYGSRVPLGGVVFLRLRPARSVATGMEGMVHAP